MLELEVLVLELLSVDGLSTGAVAPSEITALDHEVLDDAVEGRALVSKALLAGRESTEVLCRLGDRLAVETDDDFTEGFVTMLNLEVDLYISQRY